MSIMENNNVIEWYGRASSTNSYNIVSLVAYLIGVKRDQFDRSTLSSGTFDGYEANDNAKTMRCLCMLRNALMKHGDRIFTLMNELKSLDQMPEYIDPAIFPYLSSRGLQIIRANQKPLKYILQLNQLIADRINTCQPLFPLWIKWPYIRKLFIMSKGGKPDGVNKQIRQFNANINIYPFHCYIDIPNIDHGNYLFNDEKFLTIVYKINGDEFTDAQKVRDASLLSRNKLYDFVSANEKIELVVDCENSDPYQLTAVLRNIQSNCTSGIEHIQKVILYDDPHTIDTWQILSDFVPTPIEYELVERVNDHKSLVDLRMTAGTCREHYKNGVNAFLLVSSDSDFWGLISSLPTASFLSLLEHDKTGTSLLDALDAAGINYCFIDDFAGNLADIKVAALKNCMRKYLADVVHFNVNDMLDEIFTRTNLQMTAGEKQVFFDKYVKTLKLQIGSDGDVTVQIQ